MKAVIFKQRVKGSAYVCQGSWGEKAFKAKVLEGWGGKDVLGIEKPWQHEVVLHTQGSARNSHTWNMRGAEKLMATEAAGKKLGAIDDMLVLFALDLFMAFVQS